MKFQNRIPLLTPATSFGSYSQPPSMRNAGRAAPKNGPMNNELEPPCCDVTEGFSNRSLRTTLLQLPSPSRHRSIGRSVGYWQPRHRGADIRQRLSSSSPSLLSPHILLLPFLSSNTTQECRWRVNQRTTQRHIYTITILTI